MNWKILAQQEIIGQIMASLKVYLEGLIKDIASLEKATPLGFAAGKLKRNE
ncbi:MAG: hypothetical protein ISR65_15130 [Bacteriovoracaceae bacterium]|nr:hypothetical protein [Bacteriovoracaceae bacterium]